VVADLGCSTDLLRLEHRITESPALDMLVNNAGFGIEGAFVDIDPDETERMIRVHVIAPVRLTRAALPAMIASGRGTVMNISSLAAFHGNTSPTYGATKAYLNVFTESLQPELEGTGVRLLVVCPGWTSTEFQARMGVDPIKDWGVPEDCWMEADALVDAALAGLALGEVVCIPGLDDPQLRAKDFATQDELSRRAAAANQPADRYRTPVAVAPLEAAPI
jgi:short-subunit dehydrogenase